ncbi:hypothetical protein CAMRE0001_2045 [Campylobacter rectus RM3267]|uniref:Uncharacterized protein n=1 Tax=Campylobacter rectus RM3267 TaxID=553218 RepID=B9D4I9_CAMRE|nr:hypothetical protein CAMRE0001_2045 [Campylobacter rectus RM3267]
MSLLSRAQIYKFIKFHLKFELNLINLYGLILAQIDALAF